MIEFTVPGWLNVIMLILFLAINGAFTFQIAKLMHREGILKDFLGFVMLPMIAFMSFVLAVYWPLEIVVIVMGALFFGAWKLYRKKYSDL